MNVGKPLFEEGRQKLDVRIKMGWVGVFLGGLLFGTLLPAKPSVLKSSPKPKISASPVATPSPSVLPSPAPPLPKYSLKIVPPIGKHFVSIKWKQIVWTAEKNPELKPPWDNKNVKQAGYEIKTGHYEIVKLVGQLVADVGYGSKKDWLVQTKHSLAISDKLGNFVLDAYLFLDTQQIQIQIVNQKGNQDLQWIVLSKEVQAKPSSPWQFSVGLGYSQNHYVEPGMVDLTQGTGTAKGSIWYQLSPRWNIALSSYYSIFATSKSALTFTRFLGVNGRAAYSVLPKDYNLRLGVGFGFYYVSVFGPDLIYGFQNVTGPQIFPAIGYRIGQYSINAYFKYSPVSSGVFQFLDLKSRELAGGISFVTKFPWFFKTFALTADFADLSLVVDDFVGQSRSASYGFTFGY